jgi:branched-subunit amino acid transport protein
MDQKFVLLFLGMALVTYLPRFLPLYVLSRVKIPRLFIVWLKFVPVAVLAALVAPGLLMAEGQLFLSWQNSYLLASLPTFIIAIKTKNMFLTILVGLACIYLIS